MWLHHTIDSNDLKISYIKISNYIRLSDAMRRKRNEKQVTIVNQSRAIDY